MSRVQIKCACGKESCKAMLEVHASQQIIGLRCAAWVGMYFFELSPDTAAELIAALTPIALRTERQEES